LYLLPESILGLFTLSGLPQATALRHFALAKRRFGSKSEELEMSISRPVLPPIADIERRAQPRAGPTDAYLGPQDFWGPHEDRWSYPEGRGGPTLGRPWWSAA